MDLPVSLRSLELEDCDSYGVMELWILSKLSHLVLLLDENMKSINLSACVQGLHNFARNEFCDVYLVSFFHFILLKEVKVF